MFIAFYTACVLLPIGLLIFLVIELFLHKSPQVIMCTECQQCEAVCPLSSQGCHPVQIMQAAKSGLHYEGLDESAVSCIRCKKCQQACPRGLAPYLELDKWEKAQQVESNDNVSQLHNFVNKHSV